VLRTDAHARRRRGRRWRGAAALALLGAASFGAGYGAHTLTGTGEGSTVAAPPRPVPAAGTTAAGATTAPAVVTVPPARRRTLTIAAVGDTMLGTTPELPPSPATYLAGVRSRLRAAIVFGNLEGTLTDADTGKCAPGAANCYAFRAPPAYARYLRQAGFTILNDANNHSYDFGADGQRDTVQALHAAGIAQTGLPGEITLVHADGVRVAVLGFAPYSDTASLLDLPAAQALIRRAAAAADVVVVAIHAGAEGTAAMHVTGSEETYVGEDRGNPEAFAHAAVDAGADLVLGSGPHVLRGMELYRNRLIAYSLGNFAGYHNFSLGGVLADSAILRVKLAADGRFRSGRITSVRLVDAGRPVIDPAGTGARLIAQLSHDDLGAGAVSIAADGRIAAS
jgi:poly-gamma-glutamate capsule biosynthesis protein CapA/YwtB (metallophosphatase superfamily)